MAQTFSKTQIDKLGERLKRDQVSNEDLSLLSEYCDSFAEPYAEVLRLIRKHLPVEPTGREAKSHMSITAKLKRESIRLSQIQDIAGCRIVAPNRILQNRTTELLSGLFEKVTIVDRRKQPSFGYRAVHVIAHIQNKLIEIQVRTFLQQLWAEYSEAFFDLDPEIKYGGGNESHRKFLERLSEKINDLDSYFIDQVSASNRDQQLEALESEVLDLFQEGERLLRN